MTKLSRVLFALAALFAVEAQAVEVSRLKLDHPALGTTGGSALHAAVNAIYKKIGDNVSSRFFYIENLANSGTSDVDHNFRMPLSQLRWQLYLWDTGTEELTRVTASSSPAISSFTIAATPSFSTTKIRVTNSSGSTQDLVLMVFGDAITVDNLVDVSAASPTNGQVLTYNSGSAIWENAAPATADDYTYTIGSGGDYTTLAAYLAASPAQGDWLLIIDDLSETTDLNFATANIRITQRPGTIVTLAGALTNGVRMTANRILWEGMNVRLQPTGTQARGISIEATDCEVIGLLRLNTSQTFTDVVHVTSAGARAKAKLTYWNEIGTAVVTNPLTNNVTASPTSLDIFGS